MAAMTARPHRRSLENPQPEQTSYYGRRGRSRTRKKGKRPRAEHGTNGNDRTVSLPDDKAQKKNDFLQTVARAIPAERRGGRSSCPDPLIFGVFRLPQGKGLERIWRATNAFWAPAKKSAPKPPPATKPRREWHTNSQRSARNAENVCTRDRRMRHVARPTIRTRTKNQSPAAATTRDALARTNTVLRWPGTMAPR